jgi:predicted transcriptional regulator
MEKPFPVVSDETFLTEVAQQMDRETPAILIKCQDGFDIITKSDLILFLTQKDSAKGPQ